MQYRKDKNGNELSILGFGCMRFTRKGNAIDVDKAEKEIMAAYNAGVNYFDTAYIYTGSEAALGEIVERNGIRDKINIATKLPQYMIGNRKALDRFFNEELSRLRTDYVDYYLMHHLTDVAMWEKLKAVGIEQWIEEKKQSGQIRNIGFSYHGNTDNFIKILEDYDWDFCQVQYNYLDEVTQAGVSGVKAAAAKGIPVVIMEPLRGGKLVNMLPEDAKKIIEKSPRGWTPAGWAFRWLYNQPEVTVVLSGMNSLEMVEENVKTASEAEAGSFNEEDFQLLEEVKKKIREKEKVGCTGCRYCMPCPQGVDIPGTFACYNTMFTEGKNEGRFQYAQTVGLTKEAAFASQCIECGKCEMHCPQGIPIREKLKEADKALRPPIYKIGTNAARFYMYREKKPSRAARKIYSGIDDVPTGRATEDITEGCLVLEGGGWRGVYTAGALDALMQHGINFQTTIGISAGAMSAIGYVSGQIGWGARIDFTYRHDWRYCGFLGPTRTDHGVTGFSYFYNQIMKDHPVDKKRLMDPARRLVVGCTDMFTGETVYFEKGKCNLSAAVRASATVPYVSRPVVMSGVPYLDGGCSTKIPYDWALENGFKKIMVIKTREWEYRRDESPHKLAEVMYKNYPKFVESINRTNIDFNRLTDRLKEEHEAGNAFVLAPSEPVDVDRFESDMEKLGNLYWLGYNDMNSQIEELKAYLEK